MNRIAVLSFLLAVSLLPAAPLPDAVYTEIAAGVPDGTLDLTTVPGPGSYELTDAKPGLQFNLFNNVTVLAAGVTLKPTEAVSAAVGINGGTQTTGGAYTRLQATGTIVAGTTQLQCQYITGEPVVSFALDQKLRTGSTFTLADPTGFTVCYWIWGNAPASPDYLMGKMGAGDHEMIIYISGGAPDYWVRSGVMAATGGGPARLVGPQGEDSQWHFFALYFSQIGNQMGISRDGAPFVTLATQGTLTAPATHTNLEIGRLVKLSNVWLWKGRVLNLGEVQAIYNAGRGMRYTDLSGGQKTGLLHAWEMNEAAGADREDAHGTNDLDEVSGPIAQSLDGWTGTVDRPLTDIMQIGDRVQINCGVQIYDAQEPHYSVFRGIAAISGHTITFDEPFPIACPDFVDSAAMLEFGADPQKVGAWGGDGDATPYLHPYSVGFNSYGYMQRGWGTSHDLTLYAAGRPNSGLNIRGLKVDFSDSTHTQVGSAIYATKAENVVFNDLTMIRVRGNAILFDRSNNSGVDGYTIRGDGTTSLFGPGTNYSTYACGMWGGSDIFFRNVDIIGNGIVLFNAESGSIDTSVENTRLVGGAPTAGQTWSGQHFGVYAQHHQSDGGPQGIRFKNCYFDTPNTTEGARYYTAYSGGQHVTNMTYAGGDLPEWTTFNDFHGVFRIGRRIFGPRAPLSYNFSVPFTSSAMHTAMMPAGLYLPWPVLTIDTRANLNWVYASDTTDLFVWNPTGLVLDFGVSAAHDDHMQIWTTGYPAVFYGSFQTWLNMHKIQFWPSSAITETRNYTLTAAEYFPEVTDTIGPRTPIVASTGGVLRAANGKSIALVATP